MVTKTICLGYRLLICQPATLKRCVFNASCHLNTNSIKPSVTCNIHTSDSLNRASRDYYKILGISPSASTKEIRDAYVEAAKKTHPDRHGISDIIDGFNFVDIQEAYEVLSDKQRKAEYDSLHGGYKRKSQIKDRYKASARSWNRESGVAPEKDLEQDNLKSHYNDEPAASAGEGIKGFMTLTYTISFILIVVLLTLYGISGP